jgi:hypothetical protein
MHGVPRKEFGPSSTTTSMVLPFSRWLTAPAMRKTCLPQCWMIWSLLLPSPGAKLSAISPVTSSYATGSRRRTVPSAESKVPKSTVLNKIFASSVTLITRVFSLLVVSHAC